MAVDFKSQYAMFYTTENPPQVIWTGTAIGLIQGCVIKSAVLRYGGVVRTLNNQPLPFTVLHGNGATNYASFSSVLVFRSRDVDVDAPDIDEKSYSAGTELLGGEIKVGASLTITITNNGQDQLLPTLFEPIQP